MAQYLDGLRVLDLTRLLPGPMCTMFFADMGADVVKIEDTNGGDYARYYPPMAGEHSAFFASLNRNKRSLKLNLKAEGGPEVLKRLVADADVLIESFRPGVMDRLGVGWDVLREVNPRLVYCAISGYGQTGPMRDTAGHDLGYMARTGLLDLMGRKDGRLIVPPLQVADIAGGSLWAAVGVLAALFGRERTGEGAFVDISMTEGVMPFAIPSVAALAAGEPPARGDEMLTGGLPCYDVYETRDGRHLAVAPLEPKFWTAFTQTIGKPELATDLLDTSGETKRVIAEVLAEKTLAEWTSIFEGVDACCEPVLTLAEALEDQQHRAREMFFQLSGLTHVRTPVTPSSREHRPAPGYGEHTAEILAEAGFDEDEIARWT